MMTCLGIPKVIKGVQLPQREYSRARRRACTEADMPGQASMRVCGADECPCMAQYCAMLFLCQHTACAFAGAPPAERKARPPCTQCAYPAATPDIPFCPHVCARCKPWDLSRASISNDHQGQRMGQLPSTPTYKYTGGNARLPQCTLTSGGRMPARRASKQTDMRTWSIVWQSMPV